MGRIQLNFDVNGNPELPTLVIAKRNGNKIGELTNISGIKLKDSMSDSPEISFSVNKYDNSGITPYWEYIKDFKLVWCKEWDTWFEMTVDKSETDTVIKNVRLQRLGEAELSQIRIYNMEVNTEDDIIRDDYVQPTLFYNEELPSASLLHRILDKAPHYKITHVDEHLKGIQRIFSFNDKSIEECFQEVSEELDVLFSYDSSSDVNGKPNRQISVYDLKSYCRNCGARGNFVGKCLKCNSTDIVDGYGEDTSICVSKDDLGTDITITVNHDEVKNCYRLEAGDDLMTATVRSCNPNGSSYIWNFSDETKEDMESDMVSLLDRYQEDYKYYKESYVSNISSLPVSSYNALVKKYNPTSNDLNISEIESIIGYAPIMQYYYDTIDFKLYLESGLLPNAILQDTNAKKEAEKLTSTALSPVAVVDKKYLTLANATTSVLNAAKVTADPRYQIKVKQSSLSGTTWTGNFTVTNYSDAKDTYDSSTINVEVNDDYETYINQKLKKALYNGTKGKYGSITQMVNMDSATFVSELKKYNSSALSSLNSCFTECIKILSEQEIDKAESDLYQTIYLPVHDKIQYIQSEVSVRESEISVITSMQNALLSLKQYINKKLDLETYLGTDNWITFNSYRREATYSNGNYISDYLNNKELFSRAEEFIEIAEYEVTKSSTYKHEISTKLKNLMVIDEFKLLVKSFSCGNWIRIKDDEGNLYKLRLLDYEIDFDNFDTITVTFSDISRRVDGLAPIKEVIIESSNIINNYNAAINKTNSYFESINDSMTDVIQDSNFNYDYIYDSSNDILDNITQLNGEVVTLVEVNDGLIRTYIGNVEDGLSSQITQTANEIRSEVSSMSGQISSISQTVNSISLSVESKVDEKELISKINMSSDAIELYSNRLIVDSNNFKLKANGDAEFSGAITSNSIQFKDSMGKILSTMILEEYSSGNLGLTLNEKNQFSYVDIYGPVYIMAQSDTGSSFLGVQTIDCSNTLTSSYIICDISIETNSINATSGEFNTLHVSSSAEITTLHVDNLTCGTKTNTIDDRLLSLYNQIKALDTRVTALESA